MIAPLTRSSATTNELDLLIHRISVKVVDVTSDQIAVARDAWRRFGRGRHRAGLNYGDCFSDALARHAGEPLLFKGDDFVHTDIDNVEIPPDEPDTNPGV